MLKGHGMPFTVNVHGEPCLYDLPKLQNTAPVTRGKKNGWRALPPGQPRASLIGAFEATRFTSHASCSCGCLCIES